MEESIINAITVYGLVAIFFFMVTNGFVSTPPSELVYGLAGVSVSSGILNIYDVLSAGVVGNVLGTFLLFVLGRWWGYNWLVKKKKMWLDKKGIHGRIAKILPGEHFFQYFINLFNQRTGIAYIGLLRCFPMVRSIISLPAGMLRMPLFPFLLSTTTGCLIWALFWTMLGNLLGASWKKWSPSITIILLGILIVLFISLKQQMKKNFRQ